MTISPLVVSGWSIFAHPLFIDQIETLLAEVDRLRERDPASYRNKNATKRLAAIAKLAFQDIPQDPSRTEYALGGTLGDAYKHWFRAKFFQQYRLFFRYRRESRIIVYAWVNDEDTKRAYESKNDAYRVFRRMLDDGNPPDSWDNLLAEAQSDLKRFQIMAVKAANVEPQDERSV
jgi:toxin YhaV